MAADRHNLSYEAGIVQRTPRHCGHHKVAGVFGRTEERDTLAE